MNNVSKSNKYLHLSSSSLSSQKVQEEGEEENDVGINESQIHGQYTKKKRMVINSKSKNRREKQQQWWRQNSKISLENISIIKEKEVDSLLTILNHERVSLLRYQDEGDCVQNYHHPNSSSSPFFIHDRNLPPPPQPKPIHNQHQSSHPISKNHQSTNNINDPSQQRQQQEENEDNVIDPHLLISLEDIISSQRKQHNKMTNRSQQNIILDLSFHVPYLSHLFYSPNDRSDVSTSSKILHTNATTTSKHNSTWTILFHDCPALTDSDVENLVRKLNYFYWNNTNSFLSISLSFSQCHNITNHTCRILAKAITTFNLSSSPQRQAIINQIHITNCVQITDKGIQYLAALKTRSGISFLTLSNRRYPTKIFSRDSLLVSSNMTMKTQEHCLRQKISENTFIQILNKLYNDISSIDFSGNDNVTDKVLVVLAKRYSSHSEENNGNLDKNNNKNNVISQRPYLKKLDLSECINITDLGVIEIITNSLSLSSSLESNPTKLEELYLSNCPNISSQTIFSFYKKPLLHTNTSENSPLLYTLNHHLSHLKILHLEQRPQNTPKKFTMKCLHWISTSCPLLNELNLRYCHFVIPTTTNSYNEYDAAQSLASLQKLVKLDMEGCRGVFEKSDVLVEYLKECERLQKDEQIILSNKNSGYSTKKSLFSISSEDGCGNGRMEYLNLRLCTTIITDALLKSFVNLYPSLQHFQIGDCSKVTDRGIQSLISSNILHDKPLHTLHIMNFPSITDDSILSFANCSCMNHNLIELNISQNPQLTSVSLQHFDKMRALESLDISYCIQLDNSAIKWLPKFSLKKFMADGLNRLTDEGVEAFCIRHADKERNPTVQYISFRQCSNLTRCTVKNVLNYFVDIVHLDMTYTSDFLPVSLTPPSSCRYEKELESILQQSNEKGNKDEKSLHQSSKHYLSIVSNYEFIGFVQTSLLRQVKVSDQLTILSKQRKKAAILVQHRYRSHQIRKEYKRRIIQKHKIRKQQAMTKLKKLLLSYIQNFRSRKYEESKLSIALWFQQRYRSWQRRLWVNEVLQRRFHSWKLYIHSNRLKQLRALSVFQKNQLTKVLKCWKELTILFLDDEMSDYAKYKNSVSQKHWQTKIYGRIFTSWIERAREAVTLRKRNSRIFMIIADVATYNTSRKLDELNRANRLRTSKLMTLAWIHFCNFVSFRREKKALIAKARCFYSEFLFKRQGIMLLDLLNKHAKVIIMGKINEEKALVHFTKQTKCQALHWFHLYSVSKLKQEKAMKNAVSFQQQYFRTFHFRKTLDILSRAQFIRLHQRQILTNAIESWEDFHIRRSINRLREWKDLSIMYKKKLGIANSFRQKSLSREIFILWQVRVTIVKKAMVLASKHFSLFIKKKFMFELRSCWKITRFTEYLNEIKELHKKFASIKIQKIARGWLQRREYKDWVGFFHWGLLRCQAQARVFLAKRARDRQRRIHLIHEAKQQENEMILMQREDFSMKLFVKVEMLTIRLQCLFRGRSGRRIAFERLQNATYELGMKAVGDKMDQLKFAQNQEKERKRFGLKEELASVTMEKSVRGFLGRCKFKRMKQHAFETFVATKVQSVFRGIKGRRRCAAIRRHARNLQRLRASRIIQAKYLRMVGFKTSKTQKKVLGYLEYLGLDTISFVPTLLRQIVDIQNDFRQVGHFIENKMQRLKARSTEHPTILDILLNNHDEIFRPTRGDAVYVIQEDHEYLGMTGQVLYFDQTTFFDPVAVVEMDIDNSLQHFLLVSSKQAFDPPKPNLLVIDKMARPALIIKDLNKFREGVEMYIIKEHSEALQNRAATIIQSQVRGVLSTRQVATRRYSNFMVRRSLNIAILDAIMSMDVMNRTVSWNLRGLPPRLEGFVSRWKTRVNLLLESNRRRMLKRLQRNANDIVTLAQKNKIPLVQNLDKHTIDKSFKVRRMKLLQFDLSPHVPMNGIGLYNGRLKKKHTFDTSVPCGIGYFEFFDGADLRYKDDKIVIIKVCRAKHLPTSGLTDDCDPFVSILCNNQRVKTTFKRRTPHPIWNETFQINFSDLNHILRLSVNDWNQILPNSAIGQLFIRLSDIPYGRRIRKWYPLDGVTRSGSLEQRNSIHTKTQDLGLIELEIMWHWRSIPNDTGLDHIEKESCIRLQCWIRQMISRKKLISIQGIFKRQIAFLDKKVILIQSRYRMSKCLRQFRTKLLRHYLVIRIQNFVRCRKAHIRLSELKSFYFAARSIQCCMRKYRAKMIRQELEHILHILRYVSATTIQANFRKYVIRANMVRKSEQDATEKYVPHSTEWISDYGTDDIYESKRLGRIVKRSFNKVLHLRGKTLISIFGEVFVETYPAPHNDLRGSDVNAVQVTIFGHKTLSMPKIERSIIHQSSSRYQAVLNIYHSVDLIKTVAWHLGIIQCFFRCILAFRKLNRKRQEKRATVALQRSFRRRYKAKIRISCAIQSLFYIKVAKRRLQAQLVLRSKALVLQCAYRCYLARNALEKCRETGCNVVDSSGSTGDFFDAAKTLDDDDFTFWCSPKYSGVSPWIVFNVYDINDMNENLVIDRIKIRAPDMTSSPKKIEIQVANNIESENQNENEFKSLKTLELEQIDAWQLFDIPHTSSRLWKMIVLENFGNSESITLSSIRFLQAKEFPVSPLINEPVSVHVKTPMKSQGIVEKESKTIDLACEASPKCWPKPQYQWFKNGSMILGATRKRLTIQIRPKISTNYKIFKCTKCLRVCDKVPSNYFRIICSYCNTQYTYPELKDDSDLRNYLDEKESHILQKISELKLLKGKVEKNTKKKIDMATLKLEEIRTSLLFSKLNFNGYKFLYDGEGEYMCEISNIRAGNLKLSTFTRTVVVYVSDPVPQVVKCIRYYTQKQRIQRTYHHSIYSSLLGNFTDGKLFGNVLINYQSGDQYWGPFIEDHSNQSLSNLSKSSSCFGVWRTCDDVLIEGEKVDNHFVRQDMNGYFKVTYCSNKGEVYMGNFVDGKKHGFGEYKYQDGSYYRGKWFQGKREGFGVLKKGDDGSFYEGEWYNDKIHGEGIWRWSDRSMYIGNNEDGVRTGKGLYINSNEDCYVGNFQKNRLHGYGTFYYSDGSCYKGYFKHNKRHGKGTFTNSNGEIYDGTMWENDKKNGTFKVTRKFVDDENSSTDDYEVQVGLWKQGQFEQWVTGSVNSRITNDFLNRFLKYGEKYDSSYAQEIATRLPSAPEGVDENNSSVQFILLSIAECNRSFVGKDTFTETQEEFSENTKLIEKLWLDLGKEQTLLGSLRNVYGKEKKKSDDIKKEIDEMEDEVSLQTQEIEAFWLRDKDSTRKKFQISIENLRGLGKKEWFSIRRHHDPPEILRALMSTVCCIMLVEDSWKMSRILLGSNVNNKHKGDEDGIWQVYDVKLLLMLDKFDVFSRASYGNTLLRKIKNRIDDPRMRSYHYALKRFGRAAQLLADFVQFAYDYIEKAYKVNHKHKRIKELETFLIQKRVILKKIDEKLKPCYEKEINLRNKIQTLESRISIIRKKNENLEKLMEKCDLLIQQIMVDGDKESKDILTQCEVVMEMLIIQVEDNFERKVH